MRQVEGKHSASSTFTIPQSNILFNFLILVLGEGIFARPPKIPAEFLLRLRRGSRSISFKIGSDLVV